MEEEAAHWEYRPFTAGRNRALMSAAGDREGSGHLSVGDRPSMAGTRLTREERADTQEEAGRLATFLVPETDVRVELVA